MNPEYFKKFSKECPARSLTISGSPICSITNKPCLIRNCTLVYWLKENSKIEGEE